MNEAELCDLKKNELLNSIRNRYERYPQYFEKYYLLLKENEISFRYHFVREKDIIKSKLLNIYNSKCFNHVAIGISTYNYNIKVTISIFTYYNNVIVNTYLINITRNADFNYIENILSKINANIISIDEIFDSENYDENLISNIIKNKIKEI